MQPLKVLVIVLGVVIVIGLAVVVVTIANHFGKPGSAGRSFDTAGLALPKGCHVVEMAAAGTRLALRLGDGSDCQVILLVDPESGREMGRIGLLAQP